MACLDGAVAPTRLPSGDISASLRLENCHVMAMGGTPASEVAQQGSNALNCRTLARMDAAEPELLALETPAARAVLESWLADRAALEHDSYGTQARLCDIETYTECAAAACPHRAPCAPRACGQPAPSTRATTALRAPPTPLVSLHPLAQ